MENRKFYVLTVAIVIAVGVFFARHSFAYEVNTHAYLTSEAIELHNKSTSENKIPSELKRFVIDGAMHEDDLPRPQNHFYDPINNRGLNGGLLGGISAKEWVNDGEEQGKLEYKPGATTSLAPVDQQKIDAYGKTTDFTWNAGIRYWLNGDKEMAMEVLGHALHLVEDMGVPEHTRNDNHVNGSAYEKYAGRYDSNTPDEQLKARLAGKDIYALDSLGDYFDGLARYSNKYFYSPGSLGVYTFPELDYLNAETKEGKYYIANKDDEGVKYYLAIKKNIANIGLGYTDVSVVETPIKESYWSLLSVRTVRYGAGVIDLFFRDAEKAKNDPNFLREEHKDSGIAAKISSLAGNFWNKTKDIAVKTGSFFGDLLKTIGNSVVSAGSFIGGLFTGDNGLTELGIIDVGDSEGLDTKGKGASDATAASTPAAAKKEALAKKNDEITALKMQIETLQKEAKLQDAAVLALEKRRAKTAMEDEATTTSAEEIPASAGMPSAPLCVYDSAVYASQGGLIINEVAWMGGVRSASDEWIELKNVSGSEIDISGWQLLNKGGGIKVRLGDLKNPIIKPGQFVLLERTDNNSAVGATADLIYSGALGNANDGLKLFDGSCGVVDEIAAASKWIAGSNETKQTMERKREGIGWHTSSAASGTPKKENSAGIVYSGGESSPAVLTEQYTQSGTGGDPVTPQSYLDLLINAVQLASASSTHDEFVELYNPYDVAVDLTGWYVQKKTKTAADFSTFAKADLFTGKQIAAYGTLTIAHPSSMVAYAIASTYGIADDNTLVIKNPNGDISDKVGWGEAGDCEGVCAANPADGQSIRRIFSGGIPVDTGNNAEDFALYGLQVSDPGLEAGMIQPSPEASAGDVGSSTTTASTSIILWNGGAQSGRVHDLLLDAWVGQRVSFASGANIGSIKFGYYNMFIPGAVDVAIFDAQGTQLWTTALVVPNISYGGYVTYDFFEPLHLDAGDYFVGSRLISGAIGIREGYGTNTCGVAVYAPGAIPSCDDGNDISMEIWSYAAEAATTTYATSTPDEQAQDSDLEHEITNSATSTSDIGNVVINEIMYSLAGTDEDREWVEIHNAGTSTVDVAEWKFFEHETNHSLAIWQGASSLPAGGYAVIAENPNVFLNDYGGYAGTIFDSAFLLSNIGEVLVLKNGDRVVDTVSYVSDMGADGDGNSLQLFGGGWQAALPTPGAENAASATGEDFETTPADAVIGQSIHDAKSNAYQASYYVQTLGKDFASEIKNVQIYAESDRIASWEAGICMVPGGIVSRCLQSVISSALIKQPTDGIGTKTLRRFDFNTPVVLNPAFEYALYVNPIGQSDLISSVYGSSSDTYGNGALYGFDEGGALFGVGIRDIYFAINTEAVLDPIVALEATLDLADLTATSTEGVTGE